jgi:hypothetical protein
MVQDVVGGVVGSVAGLFSGPQAPAPAPASSVPFSSAMNSASSAAAAATISTSCGIMRADQLGQMTNSQVQSWAKGLAGRHVDATDAAGHAISGVVNGVVQSGSSISLNINGHLVDLANLKQISWSATAAA